MTHPRRMYGAALVAALVIAGAAVGALIFQSAGKADNVELTSAQLVPADAGAYVGLNTDLSSAQWLAAFNFARRLGQANPRSQVRQTAQDAAGLDWVHDVAPFLGGNAGLYVSSFDLSGETPGMPNGAAIIRCTDATKALDVVARESGASLQNGMHDGVTYRFDADKPIYLALLDQDLVIAGDEQSLFNVLDVHAGTKPSLASVVDFKTLHDELTNSFLGFVYINTQALVSQAQTQAAAGVPGLQQALASAGASASAIKPSAMVIAATRGSLQFQSASIGSYPPVAALLQQHQSRFAKLVPANTSVFVSAAGVADVWNKVQSAAGTAVDQALLQQGEAGGLNDAMQEAAQRLGVDSLSSVVNLLNGEVAVAAWFPAGAGGDPTGVVLAEVNDEQAARAVLDSALKQAGGKVSTEQMGNAQVTMAPNMSGLDIGYTVTDGYLAIGTRPALKAVLTGNRAALADTSAYKQTVAQLPTGLGTYAYLDLGALLRRSGVVPSELGGIEDYVQGLIVNLVEERGISRLSGVLTAQ